MDGSDDYGFDDFVLDPQALAALDQAESQFQQSLQAQAPVADKPSSHVNKRSKTSKGWTPGVGAKPTPKDDYDDLPEISVRGDGTYGLGSAPTRPAPDLRRNANQSRGSPANTSVGRAPDASTSRSETKVKAVRPAPIARPQQPQYVAPGRDEIRRQATPIAGPSRNDQAKVSSDSHRLHSQLQDLQKKLDQMRQENEQAQAALKNAVEVKLMKEGEVSVLRRTIEKNSQSHAAQLAQIKAEKERSDAKQVQLQKELKGEMERLRTQFLFKQQELEASVRKPPMSAKTKRVGREFPSTPVAVPPAMRSWQREASQSTSRKTLEDTPLRPTRPVPKTSPMKDIRESPARSKKNPPLGFQNGFDTSTPMRSPSKRNKGKAKQDPPMFGEEPNIPPPAFSQHIPGPPSQILFRESQSSSLPSSSNDFGPNMATFDQEMGTATQESDADALLIDEIDVINWKSELCRIFLTHIHPAGEEITFQLLLSYSPSIQEKATYSASCSKIMAVLAASSRVEDYLDSIRIVCGSLLTMVDLLYRSTQLNSLTILLNLMSRLVAQLPSFSSYLLSTDSANPERKDQYLGDFLQTITLQQMTSDKAESLNSELANEVLTLLETLCAYISSDSVPHLRRFVNNRDVVLVLLQIQHPEWFLERSTRLLVLLASHHELWESLLGLSQADDLKRLVVDKVCSHIVDLNKPATTTYKVNILTFVAQIAISDPSAYAALIDSPTLIPSLLLFTSHLATPLWEDDSQLVLSEERLASVTRLLNQILFLLYHLIFGKNPAVSLSNKIQHAPSRAFNCLIHIFTVTFGRLGYCDPPSWMDSESRRELESMAEIARDILELVFDGPEGDTIWSTFQFDQDEEVEPDEEEF